METYWSLALLWCVHVCIHPQRTTFLWNTLNDQISPCWVLVTSSQKYVLFEWQYPLNNESLPSTIVQIPRAEVVGVIYLGRKLNKKAAGVNSRLQSLQATYTLRSPGSILLTLKAPKQTKHPMLLDWFDYEWLSRVDTLHVPLCDATNVSVSQVYTFNSWTTTIRIQIVSVV